MGSSGAVDVFVTLWTCEAFDLVDANTGKERSVMQHRSSDEKAVGMFRSLRGYFQQDVWALERNGVPANLDSTRANEAGAPDTVSLTVSGVTHTFLFYRRGCPGHPWRDTMPFIHDTHNDRRYKIRTEDVERPFWVDFDNPSETCWRTQDLERYWVERLLREVR